MSDHGEQDRAYSAMDGWIIAALIVVFFVVGVLCSKALAQLVDVIRTFGS